MTRIAERRNADELMTDFDVDPQIQVLLDDYAAGRKQPYDTLLRLHGRARDMKSSNVWITLLDWEAIQAQIGEVEARRAAGASLPLYGIPFAVKDNMDVSDVPTTAACPGFQATPRESAPVVALLMAAGAIMFGKTNLDQFATGLVGTRSPYGACSSAFDPRYISGGSSSGSALAVALGLVSFALGTDTAGSGRVPAALNNIVGLKPTRGLLSTRGVVPACRSLDCVSVFAGNVADAALVLSISAGFDARDPFSRAAPAGDSSLSIPGFRFGVPARAQLQLFGDQLSDAAYERAIEALAALGGELTPVDFDAFKEAGSLLYSGPWVAERAAVVGEVISREPAGLDPTVASIIRGASRYDAAAAFSAQHRLHELRRSVEALWQDLDVLVVPTVPTTYTREQIAADPFGPNQALGTYTNFTNLLDLCGIAVPAGFKAKDQPFGITLIGPAFSERALIELASRFHRSQDLTVGATPFRVRQTAPSPPAPRRVPRAPALVARVHQSVRLAVVGAHLIGEPLHFQLVELGARFEGAARTAEKYRLYALDGTVPAKPGLVRQGIGGAAIEVEVFALDAAAFGQFVAQVPAPLGIGNVELSNGEWVKGFLCESVATENATDITDLGGWRAYRSRERAEMQ